MIVAKVPGRKAHRLKISGAVCFAHNFIARNHCAIEIVRDPPFEHNKLFRMHKHKKSVSRHIGGRLRRQWQRVDSGGTRRGNTNRAQHPMRFIFAFLHALCVAFRQRGRFKKLYARLFISAVKQAPHYDVTVLGRGAVWAIPIDKFLPVRSSWKICAAFAADTQAKPIVFERVTGRTNHPRINGLREISRNEQFRVGGYHTYFFNPRVFPIACFRTSRETPFVDEKFPRWLCRKSNQCPFRNSVPAFQPGNRQSPADPVLGTVLRNVLVANRHPFLRQHLRRQGNPCRQKQRNADNVNQRRETEKSGGGGGGVEMGANAVARRRTALKNAASAFNPPARIKSARTQMKACKIMAGVMTIPLLRACAVL